MMTFAFMSFSTPGLSLEATLALAQQCGYDGIEPRMDAGHAHGIELATTAAERAGIRRRAEAAGIQLACLATSLTYVDPAQQAATHDATLARLALSADLGIPVLRVFGGQRPDGMDRDTAIAGVAQALEPLAAAAAAHGVTLCLETHDDWCDPDHVAAVMERVNHPAIAVNWDVMHPVRVAGWSMQAAFDRLAPWIRHVHVHDGTGNDIELAPIGEGVYDHRVALQNLQASGYAGAISGEWINWSDPYEQHLPRELATMKQYLQDGV